VFPTANVVVKPEKADLVVCNLSNQRFFKNPKNDEYYHTSNSGINDLRYVHDNFDQLESVEQVF
jgi:hypothetical protein